MHGPAASRWMIVVIVYAAGYLLVRRLHWR